MEKVKMKDRLKKITSIKLSKIQLVFMVFLNLICGLFLIIRPDLIGDSLIIFMGSICIVESIGYLIKIYVYGK